MSLPRILVFGHSHMGALLEAYRAEAANDTQTFELVSYQFLREDRPHIVHLDGKWRYHPDCEKELGRMIQSSEPTVLASMLQGEQAVLAGMIAPEKTFEFYFPGEEAEFSAPAEIVPFDILFEMCQFEHRLISALLDNLKDLVSMPALALSPPPPIGDSDFILASNPNHANIGEYIHKHGLPLTHWRYRIWKLHTLALRAIYQEHGIAFVDPPRESQGDDGCLLNPFWSDVFHANARYGHLLLRQIQSFVTNGL